MIVINDSMRKYISSDKGKETKRKYFLKHKKKLREYVKSYMKNKRKEAKKKKICLRCFKRKVVPGKTICVVCRIAAKKQWIKDKNR